MINFWSRIGILKVILEEIRKALNSEGFLLEFHYGDRDEKGLIHHIKISDKFSLVGQKFLMRRTSDMIEEEICKMTKQRCKGKEKIKKTIKSKDLWI